MSEFMDKVNDKLNNRSVTENGAIGFKTTGRALLDFNFSVASFRDKSDAEIINRWVVVMDEARKEGTLDIAFKWLFFARDIREGLGERRLFRVIFSYLISSYTDYVIHLLHYIPNYGRWDDLIELFFLDYTSKNPLIGNKVRDILKSQLDWDISIVNRDNHLDEEDYNYPISLLAKWMPSINTSSKLTRIKAKQLARSFKWSYRKYQKVMVNLRSYLDVVETKMSANKWSEINYEKVPSKANINYRNAFLRHDEERRLEYLENVSEGKAKINSSAVFPHEIIHKLYDVYNETSSTTLEEMWKALPNLVDPNSRTIVVGDGSGSMERRVCESSTVTPLEVCIALSIYFAERLHGEFHNKYITFSERPQLVDLNNVNTLYEKVKICRHYTEVANTNIEAVFNLILDVATENNMSQEDIPDNILIISDMEFDNCAISNAGDITPVLMSVMNHKFITHGYKLPRIIFWRVNGRTDTIPMKENDLGVTLVSGFSINICKMVMSSKIDPYECLLEQLLSDRYKNITVCNPVPLEGEHYNVNNYE